MVGGAWQYLDVCLDPLYILWYENTDTHNNNTHCSELPISTQRAALVAYFHSCQIIAILDYSGKTVSNTKSKVS